MKSVPVFLHIPKNAGTYVLGWCSNLIRMEAILSGKNNKLGWNLALRTILVKKEEQTVFTALAYDPKHLSNPKFLVNPQNQYVSEIDINSFLYEMHKIDISSMHIESYGFKFLKTDFFQRIFVFQIKVDHHYMSYEVMKNFCETELKCDVVSLILKLSVEESVKLWINPLQKLQELADKQKYNSGSHAEGIVVRPSHYPKSRASRRPLGFKLINRNYND